LRRIAKKVPGLSGCGNLVKWLQIRYCQGVFQTFREARAAVPPWSLVGYDNQVIAKKYEYSLDSVKPSDYPILFWLRPLLPEVRSVFDFGGNLGLSYYSFQKYLRFPADLRWVICDVPAVLEAGREVALQRNATNLEFTADFARADRCDAFISSGTLQYVEEELALLLSRLHDKPRHLLISRVPLSDHATFFTVQNIGDTRCPYRIANRQEFVASLQRLGYSLADTWLCPDVTCRILFRPSRRIRNYTGMYFRLATSNGAK
jgi:putative methyltransferase (TIGR04325 family)